MALPASGKGVQSAPSLQDGLRPDQVVRFKRTAIDTIIQAGSRLQMDQLAIYTAVVFLHRFYVGKSFVRNDPFLMSLACLYLGGKVEDSPKSVRDVVVASCELRYGAELAKRLTGPDKAVFESLREKVFVAERALLYALDFQFNVEHPYEPLFSMFQSGPLRALRERDPGTASRVAQLATNLATDCVFTEACLYLTGRQIATAAIWLAMKLYKQDTHVYTDDGQLWWVAQGVREEHLEGFEDFVQELYGPNMYEAYSNNDLVLQSATLVPPQHAAAHAAQQAQQAAAAAQQQAQQAAGQSEAPVAGQEPGAGAGVKQERGAGAGALPAGVAAANRESWAAVAAAPPLAAAGKAGKAAAAAKGAPAAATPAKQEEAAADDYDDLLAELG